MSLTSWFLVSGGGIRHRLPREMIFVGRDDCELMLQSRSVDKQHAVINYEADTDEHKVKDLGSLNGTFVNDVRIQEQVYVTLKMDDKLRFGYDTNLFTVVRGELHVPEEALKHEKYTSQLQLAKKPADGGEVKGAEGNPEGASKPPEPTKGEEKAAVDTAVVHRGTPLYGQPSWWGDGDGDDGNSRKQETKTSDHKHAKGSETVKQQMASEVVTQAQACQEPSYFEIPSKETLPGGDGASENPHMHPDGAAAPQPAPGPETGAHGHASFTIEFDTAASGKVTVKDRVAKGNQDHRQRVKRGAGEELSALQAAMVAAEVKVADWLAQNELPLARSESVAEDDGDSVKSDVPVQLRSLRGSKHEDGTQSDSENALGEQLSSRRAFLQDRCRGRPGVYRTEGPFTAREDLYQDKPKKMAPVGGEAGGGGGTYHSAAGRAKITPHHREQAAGCREGPGRGHADDQSDRGTYTIELENGNTEEEEARRMIDKVFGVEDNQALTKLRYPEHQRDRVGICPRTGATEARGVGHVAAEVLPEDLVVVGGPRWVSQWASLAASHIRTDPEGSGAESHVFVSDEKASTGQSERKRRTLPQVPSQEDSVLEVLAPEGPRNRPGRRAPSSEKQDNESQEKEDQLRGTSKAAHRVAGISTGTADMGRGRGSKQTSPKASQEARHSAGQQGSPKSAGAGEKKQEAGKRKKQEEDKEKTGKPLLRQESFTVERPSTNVPLELIPCIDSTQPREMPSITEGIDATTLIKDSEAVAAFLETTLSDLADPPSYSLEGSFSPESDIDTTSTVSQAGGEAGRKVVQKKRTAGANKGTGGAGAQEQSDRKGKFQPSGQTGSRARAWASLDLTDDDINTSSMPSDVHSSQRERVSARAHGRGQPLNQKVDTSSGRARGGKATTAAPSSTGSKPATLPRPRQTRASLLRRARLGDTSDTDLADVDRVSVASEASTASSTSRPSAGRRTLSRIEALAQPRRPRVGSPSARSDSEATSGRNRGFASRPAPESALRLGLRSTATPSTVAVPRARANSASKLPDKSGGSSYVPSTPASNGRWRRVPIEYASTSEDEFGSNRHPSKHTRPRPLAPRVSQLGGSAPATPSPSGLSMLRHQVREQDDYMRDWTAHSEEIARISQDLAKDLAMLAREIHDVAGEIDSVSPSAVEHAAADDHVFTDSQGSTPEISGRPVELRPRSSSSQESRDPRAIRRRTWNRDEAVLDSLLLASVSQLSAKIRQGVDKTAGKIRILFKDKDRNWEEIESKLQAENEVPFLRTSNQEISSILRDLKSVERQLLVIDIMVDPDGTLDALTSLGLTSPLMSDRRVSPGSQVPVTSHPSGDGTAGAALEPTASSVHTEVAERDFGPHVDSQPISNEQNTAGQK
ncbi:centrosomal protein of 170 kDa [Chanos chanos]|uniref:Centrosomal protein of 170 kDa n=1 Tax=Chanos chanos TaxID=29144 RepID=A0A6J2W076_CHACN|nr:centrosomal protein of 170 kDa-like [Chanos chanos]